MTDFPVIIDYEAMLGPIVDEPETRQARQGSFLLAALIKADKDQLDRIEAKLDQLLSRSPDNRPCCPCTTLHGNETIYCQCNCHSRQ